jgi:CubicO group peptidase (beta-lactamase class C family)
MRPDLDAILSVVDLFGAEHAAVALVGPDGVLATHGDADRRFVWASVTKPFTAMTVLIAAERGLLDLDEPAGPPGSTVRHLLAHASGLSFEGETLLAAPGRKRIYSNTGYDTLGDLVASRAGKTFESALVASILIPLEMDRTFLDGLPSEGLGGTIVDLATFARELLRPTLLTPAMAAAMREVAFPGLSGVVPGIGRFDPCDWGLGVEIHDAKRLHWMGVRNSPATFGHFGGSGTFLWVDPVVDRALVVLTDRPFGAWALDAWPAFSDALLTALGQA